MNDYACLIAYLPYFESADGPETFHFEGEGRTGEGSFSQPVYDQRFLEFIEAVYESGLIDIAYFSILNRDLSSGCPSPADILEDASLDLLRSVLAYYIRQERFQEGLWVTAIRDRVFLKALRRLDWLMKARDGGGLLEAQV